MILQEHSSYWINSSIDQRHKSLPKNKLSYLKELDAGEWFVMHTKESNRLEVWYFLLNQ